MKHIFINRFKNESGQVLVLAALLMTVLMGFAAFAVDIGRVAVVKSNLQNAADAAALAGAGVSANYINAAESTVLSNGVDKAAGDIVNVTLLASGETIVEPEPLYSEIELNSKTSEQLIVLAKKHGLEKYITKNDVNKFSQEYINSISSKNDEQVIQIAKDNDIYDLIKEFVHNNGKKFEKDKRGVAEGKVKTALEAMKTVVESLTEEDKGALIIDLLKLTKPQIVTGGKNTTKVKVELSKTIPYTFAKVIGFQEETISATAVALSTQENAIGEAADYTVFSEEELKWNGGNYSIYGDVYGGKGIKFTGNNNMISGVFEYHSGSIFKEDDFDIKGGINKVSPIAMPNLLNKINESTIKVICTTQSQFNDAVADGIDGIIYFESNSTLNINGRIQGTGIVCAKSDIVFKADQTDDDKVSFYSINGDITFNGGSGSIYGILYAPSGTIEINGTPHNNEVHGRMIGKNVTTNGNDYKVITDEDDLEGIYKIPGKKVIKLIE